ncbi:MAG: hypothetical protein FRX49_12763 [Trebouxia sp. A1-2]|nr:MAG: hypothetical protein FRX49_12763 [Trebouxia sp. A1-2]
MPPSKDADEEELSEDDQDFEEEEEEDNLDEGQAAQKQSKKRKGASFMDDAAEEDDEEDEDEEDRGRQRKKRNRFIDDIAAVDEEEEEEEDEDEEEGFLEKDELPSAQEQMGLYRPLQNRNDGQDMDAAAIDEYVRERFVAPSQSYAEVDDTQASEVGQQGLQPTPQDPKLWLVECKTGSEREAVVSLMQKCVDLAMKGTPLAIKAVFTQDHLKGYLYIEAHKESHVTDATKGLRIIYHSKGARLVPLKEMVSAIYVNRQAKSQLEPDAWARVKAGVYKSDLAKVMSVDYSKGVAEVKLVPRIDYAELAKRQTEGGRALPFGGHRAGKARPKAKAFSRAEAQRHRLMVEERRSQQAATGFAYYLGSNTANRYEDGYLVRDFPIKSLYVEEATPPVDELQTFNAEGDRVLVTEGDLKNLDGVVVSVNEEGKLMVKASLAELAGNAPLTIDAQHVVKFFQAGDHVTVTGGAYVGRRGTVVKVKNKVCYVFDEVAQQEFQVFARDLSFGDYDLHDLIELDQQTVGVMIQADAETCQVLTNRNAMTPEVPDIRTATLQDIKRKLYCARNISAPDSSGNPVNNGDMVDLVSQGNARLEGISGTVKYIQKGALWLLVKDKLATDTSGFLCVDSRKTQLRGGRAAGAPRAAAGIAAGFKSPAPWATPARNAFNPIVMASPRPLDNGTPLGGMGMGMGSFRGGAAGRGQPAYSGVQRTRREDNLIGKSLGYRGRVVSATETDVRIELEAQYKTVTVKKEQLKGHEGAAAASSSAAPLRAAAPWAIRTPMHPSQTPMHPSQTPMHPSQTPMHPGAATPLRDNAWSGGRTPMHPSMEDGDEDNHGSSSQRGGPSGAGYAGAPYTGDSNYNRQGYRDGGRVS